MNNVLLISPSTNSYYTLTAHLGLSYIAAKLEDYFKVYGLDLNVYQQVYDMNLEALLDLVGAVLDNYSIKYVGISVLEETLGQAYEIAKLCREKEVCCFAGGIYPTLFAESMPKEFKYCIRGDGEYIIQKFLLSLENGGNIYQIEGLSIYSEEESKWIHVGEPGAITCKDDFFPARNVFDQLNGHFRYTSARMITSRGCVYHCTFCTNKMFQNKYISRSIHNIVEEIRMLASQGIKEIILSDDQFLGTCIEEYQHALDVIKAIKNILVENNIRLNFQVRADQWLRCTKCLPEIIEVLCEISSAFIDDNPELSMRINGRVMHGVGIDIGIESFLDRKLSFFRKGYTAEKNIKCIRSLISLPVDIGIYAILFTPDITMEEVVLEIITYYDEYLSKHYESKVLLANLFKLLVPYQGTEIYDVLLKRNRLIPPRGYRFEDLRVAAFYVIFVNEIERMIYREDISFSQFFECILNFADYCRELKIEGEMKKELCELIVNQEGIEKEIYWKIRKYII